MGNRRDATPRPHTWQECAVANSGCAKKDVLAVGQIVCRIDAFEIFFVTVGDQFLPLLLIARPPFTLHVAAETFDCRHREHRLPPPSAPPATIDARSRP